MSEQPYDPYIQPEGRHAPAGGANRTAAIQSQIDGA